MNRTKIEDFIEELKSLSNRYHEGYVIHKHELDELIERHSTSLLAEDEGEGWISVEERLPEKDVRVFAIGKNWIQPDICRMSDEDEFGNNEYCWRWDFDLCPVKDGNVTHWQPLPKAPSQPQKGERV